MKVRAFHSAAALTVGFAMTGVVMAQTPQTPQPPRTPAEQTRPQQHTDHLRAMDGKTVTVTGCLMQEQKVAGQTPNPAERVGAAPDYVLTNVQMRSTEPGAAGATPSAGTPGAAGAMGASNLKVKLTSVDNDQMRANLNKQVEVTGRLEVDAGDDVSGAKAAEPKSTPEKMRDNVLGDMNALPELHVANVRVTGQACTPAKQ